MADNVIDACCLDQSLRNGRTRNHHSECLEEPGMSRKPFRQNHSTSESRMLTAASGKN